MLFRNAPALLLLLPLCVFAQAPPAVQWQRNLGGSASDFANSIAQTADGGYIVCGTTLSNDGDVSGNHGMEDIWAVKLDAVGDIEWQRCLGGPQSDVGRYALAMSDGGFAILGSTRSNSGDVSGNHGMADFWLAKLDFSGNLVWQHCYGGSLNDVPFSMRSTPDGGFIMVGESRSSDGDLTSNNGSWDVWILKVNMDGDIQWQQSYGGSFGDTAFDIALTLDGGYILNGYTSSNDGDVTGSLGGEDYWVLKLDANGEILWQRPSGGSGSDFGFSVVEFNDGSIIAFGESTSSNGDVSDPFGLEDFWMIRFTPTGVVLGDRSYGGSNRDRGRSLHLTGDGGAILCGSTESNDGDIPNNQGSSDGWIFRTDEQGQIIWNKTMGGTQADSWVDLRATTDGGYVVAGTSNSSDGDLPGNHGDNDIWVVKLGPDPLSVQEVQHEDPIRVFPNPSKEHIQVELPERLRNALWQLHDAQGKVVASGRANGTNQHIAAQHLAAGAYTLVVEAQGVRRSVVLMKE